MTLLMHELVHFSLGITLGLIMIKLTKRSSILLWTLLASLFIDIDHIIDYLLIIGPQWDLNAILTGSYFVTSGRVMVFLHSWELAVALIIVGLKANRTFSIAFLGLGVGMIGHLFVDQFWYNQPYLFYFLSVRWLHGFMDPRFW